MEQDPPVRVRRLDELNFGAEQPIEKEVSNRRQSFVPPKEQDAFQPDFGCRPCSDPAEI